MAEAGRHRLLQLSRSATNRRALALFWDEITKRWQRVLNRRSQRGNLTRARMMKLAADWLPRPRIRHLWPAQRFAVTHPRCGAVCGKAARTVLCGGALINERPYRDRALARRAHASDSRIAQSADAWARRRFVRVVRPVLFPAPLAHPTNAHFTYSSV